MKEKEWVIVKIFQKYCSHHSSLYQREFLIDALEIIKFINSLKNENLGILPKSIIWYWNYKIKKSIGLKDDLKKFFCGELSKIMQPNSSIKNVDFEEWGAKTEQVNSLTSDYSFHKVIENKIKDIYINFGNGLLNTLELELIIKEYISSRLSLQYSLKRIGDLLKGLKFSLHNNENFEDKLKEVYDLLSAKNLKRKENYKIFVPVSIRVQNPKGLSNLKDQFKTDNFSILRYSDVEKEIVKINHFVVKDFNKDCMYFAFNNVEGVDIETETYKIVFEKSAFYSSLLESFNVEAKIIFDSPVITHKKTQNNHKINGIKIRNTSFIEIEHNATEKWAIEALQLFKTGEFGDRTKNKKGFLISKTNFASSNNPLEKVHLANRLTELYLKSDFKKGYGGMTKFEAFEDKVTNKIWNSLLKTHKNFILLSNYSEIANHFSKKGYHDVFSFHSVKSNYQKLEKMKTLIDGKPEKRGMPIWLKHVMNEVDFLEKMSNGAKSQFIGYIFFVFLYVHFKRNAFIHSSVVFNQRDAFLAETLEAFLSLAFSRELNFIKNQKKVYNVIA